MKRNAKDIDLEGPLSKSANNEATIDPTLTQILAPYLLAPTLISWATVSRNSWHGVKAVALNYCQNICTEKHCSVERHWQCMVQVYDLFCHGYITVTDYDALHEKYLYYPDQIEHQALTRRSLFEGHPLLEIQPWTIVVSPSCASFDMIPFYTFSYPNTRIVYDIFALADDYLYVSPALLRGWIALTYPTEHIFSFSHLITSQIPLDILEDLAQRKKILWTDNVPLKDPDYALSVLTLCRKHEPIYRSVCEETENSRFFDWKSDLTSYIPALKLLVATRKGAEQFLRHYTSGLSDEDLLEIFSVCKQETFDGKLKHKFHLEKLLFENGFLTIAHWDIYYASPSPDVSFWIPPKEVTSYLLDIGKLYDVIIVEFFCQLGCLYMKEMISHIADVMNTIPESRAKGVDFFYEIFQRRSDEYVWYVVGKLYFPRGAPARLLTRGPSGLKAYATYDYLWLRSVTNYREPFQ
jgi:hypothetical protein